MAAKLWTTNQGQISGDLVSDLQGHKSLLEVTPICWYTDLARKVYCLPLSVRNLHRLHPRCFQTCIYTFHMAVVMEERISNLAH